MNYFYFFCIPVLFWREVEAQKDRASCFFEAISFSLPIFVFYISKGSLLILTPSDYSQLISIFSIFAAFLFASQMSIYTIFRGVIDGVDKAAEKSKSSNSEDIIQEGVHSRSHAEKIVSLKNGYSLVNCSISYLVFSSVVILTLLVLLILFEGVGENITAILLALVVHFFIILVFAIGQSHLVFSIGYERDA